MSEVFTGSADISLKDNLNWALASRYSSKAGLYAGVLSAAAVMCVYLIQGRHIDKAEAIGAMTAMLIVPIVTVVLSLIILILSHSKLSRKQRLVKWAVSYTHLTLPTIYSV